MSVLGLHTGVEPEHWLESVQSTQACCVRSHTGVGSAQCVELVQSTQRCEPVSHTGVGSAHCLESVQPMHCPALTSHTGVAPPHCLESVQPTHLLPSQTGVLPEQRKHEVPHNALHAWQLVPPQLTGSLAVPLMVVSAEAASRSEASV